MTARPATRLLVLLVMALLPVACSDSLPRLAPLAEGAVILAFGDSITRGNGAGTGQDYPSVLGTLAGLAVINAGSPGEVTSAARTRLPALLDRHRPGLLILCHGGNDLLRKLDTMATRANLEAMIDMAHTRDIPVMLIGVPQPGLFMLESAEFYRELATQHGLLYDGDILPEVYSDNGYKSDRIHPNAAGYRLMAETIFEKLAASGALQGR